MPTCTPETVIPALRLFLEDSSFNGDLAQGKCRSHPDNVLRMWAELEGKKRFPLSELVNLWKGVARFAVAASSAVTGRPRQVEPCWAESTLPWVAVTSVSPVHEEIWDADLEAIEWRLYEIPVIPMGYDLWNDDWADLREPAPYLLHMQHSRDSDDYLYGRDTFAGFYPDHQVPPDLERQQLVETLRQEPFLLPELAALPDLIQMLDHNTGNAWLDAGEISLAEAWRLS